MSKITDKQYEEIIAGYMIAARHARNFPHPEIPIERLRSEATQAESNAEYILGRDGFDRINKIAFPEAKLRTKKKSKQQP